MKDEQGVLESELRYHEKLYGGFAQSHFARPAVRSFREHSAARIRQLTGVGPHSRVLSLGCGIGDAELLLAPHVEEIVGVDLSPAAVRQARDDAERSHLANASFLEGTASAASGQFDVILAIFFLHHLSDRALADLPRQVAARLEPGGVFYSLDPSIRRLSGAIGRRLIPKLMKRYQTENERELDPEATARLFREAGFEVRSEMYDLGSTPLAGLFPGWRTGYLMARWADDQLLRSSVVRRVGSNFELVARIAT
jgi:cyclopropane fatty-acyl-phospholipid synthase-like methyltransferase